MQADPALNETDSHLSERQHQLGDEYQRDKIKIIVSDTLVNHRLGEERKDKRENTSQQHPYHQLKQLRLVRKQVAQVERKVFLLLFMVVYTFVKFGSGSQQQGESGFLPFILSAHPAFLESCLADRILSFRWVGNIKSVIFCRFGEKFLFLPDIIQHDKMVLVPMKDTRQRNILNQLLKVDTYSLRSHAYAFGGITNT